MSRQYRQQIDNKPKVIALAQHHEQVNVARLAALAAAAFAFVFYFFSFFFGGIQWRVPGEQN